MQFLLFFSWQTCSVVRVAIHIIYENSAGFEQTGSILDS